MAKPPPGVPLSPQITRRGFLKTLLGAAVSAATPGLPKVLDAAPGLPAAPVPEFVTDPKMLSGFNNGISTMGKWGGQHASTWVDGEWPEIETMSGNQLRSHIHRLGLDKASASIPEFHGSDRVGHYAWNKYTQQWHPVVAMPGGRPNVTSFRYLEPGSPVPENALPVDIDGPWQHLQPAHELENEMFSSPADFGKQLMEDWHRHKTWEFQEDGPDKAEMRDPEYRRRYLKHATQNRLAPGGRPETPRALQDSGLPTGNVAIPGADDAGHLPSMIGRLRRLQKPAATGIMSLAPLLLAPGEEEKK